jgi:uncharacterized protein (DUF2384 family)
MEKQRPTRDSELAGSRKGTKSTSARSGDTERASESSEDHTRKLVMQALSKLQDIDPAAAMIVTLKLFSEMSSAEVASALQISEVNLHGKYARAVAHLREIVKTETTVASLEDATKDTEGIRTDAVLHEIIERATEIIGGRQEAMRWLGTPVRGLDYATPISLLATEEGVQRVNDILGRIEHGVW